MMISITICIHTRSTINQLLTLCVFALKELRGRMNIYEVFLRGGVVMSSIHIANHKSFHHCSIIRMHHACIDKNFKTNYKIVREIRGGASNPKYLVGGRKNRGAQRCTSLYVSCAESTPYTPPTNILTDSTTYSSTTPPVHGRLEHFGGHHAS